MQVYAIKFCENIGLFLPGFQKGLLAGMVIIVAALVFMELIRLMFRISGHSQCNGIRSKGANGELFVSVSAVRDIVKSLGAEFKDFTIVNIKLYRRGRKFSIGIRANLKSYDANLSTLVPDFQSRIIGVLGSNLGISNICQVNVRIKRVK